MVGKYSSLALFLTFCRVENNLLRNLTIFRPGFVYLLVIGVFVNSLFPQACLCGEACLHGLQGKSRSSLLFLFHTRCLGTQCKSCDLEDTQTLKASNPGQLTGSAHTLVSQLTLYILSYCQSDNDPVRNIFPHSEISSTAHSTPTYLQHLTLLI